MVEIENEVRVVQSFDHGKYTLADGTEITQWELLKDRKDGGVTLEADQRRFVFHLVTTHVNMMAHVVPLLKQKKSKSVTTYMLWNRTEALKTETNKERKVELKQIIKQVDTLRDLTLRIFTKAAVKDTLPASFWAIDIGTRTSCTSLRKRLDHCDRLIFWAVLNASNPRTDCAANCSAETL